MRKLASAKGPSEWRRDQGDSYDGTVILTGQSAFFFYQVAASSIARAKPARPELVADNDEAL